jgi:hypothetical protein
MVISAACKVKPSKKLYKEKLNVVDIRLSKNRRQQDPHYYVSISCAVAPVPVKYYKYYRSATNFWDSNIQEEDKFGI